MRSVLVTGATGFFGQAFVRRMLTDGVERICIYSRDEWKQAQMRAQFQELDKDGRLRFFIGDVRDRDRLRRAMEGVEAVTHAAALKRIEVGAYNPGEMIKTNVLGTMNVIEAAADAGVKKIVFLSSDKAFQPISPYGHTKALAEKIILATNETYGANGPIAAACRYGNVAGSTGSVIPVWRNLLEYQKTVPVTDPDCTRFWMTRDQAVDLVTRTLFTMRGKELIIPDLPAFRLGDLAEAMGARMELRGLGDFEKKHESMCDGNSSETARRMTVDDLKENLAHV